jgi:hypothetical protein
MTVESHVTVIDDLVDVERIIAVASATPPLRLRVSRSARWIAPDPGLFLVVDDPHSDLRRFREALLGPESATYRAHVTLLHRDSINSQEQLDEAWGSLGNIDLAQDFIVEELIVHDFAGGVWREVARPRFAT